MSRDLSGLFVCLAVVVVLVAVSVLGDWLQYRKFKPAEPRLPKPGERWPYRPRNKREGDPFQPKGGHSVAVVLQVERGWVRYDVITLHGGDEIVSDQRVPVCEFVDDYQPPVSPPR